jgi:hypothetical protein
MTYSAHVKNGVIVVDDNAELPEGASLRIEVISKSETDGSVQQAPTLYERLKPVIGAGKDLPADLSKNHDHYLYGTPKK